MESVYVVGSCDQRILYVLHSNTSASEELAPRLPAARVSAPKPPQCCHPGEVHTRFSVRSQRTLKSAYPCVYSVTMCGMRSQGHNHGESVHGN